MQVPLTWRFLLAFYCFGALLGMSHELAHDVAGRLICGDWGYKTFNSFTLAQGCATTHPDTFWLATLVWPVLFNYLPMWLGVVLMLRNDRGSRLLGVALVMATVPALRIFSVLGSGYETWLVNHLFGDNPVALRAMQAVALALLIPPLVLAWRTIENQQRWLVYLLLFIGVPITVFVLVGIVLESLIEDHGFLAEALWGMPYLVLLAELVATVGYYAMGHHLRTADRQPSARGAPAL